MATSTYKSYLMQGTGTGTITYSKLVDIKDYPDLGGAPETIETTTLSDSSRTYIPGLQENERLVFNANYTESDYATLVALVGTEGNYGVFFGGTDGADGKFTFKGYLDVHVTGAGVNEVRSMEIGITPSSAIEFTATTLKETKSIWQKP